MKKRSWNLPNWAYIPIAIFDIFAILVFALVVILTGLEGYKELDDYPGSIWYCEETNMRATVIVPDNDDPYIEIVDLDDGQRYSVELNEPYFINELYYGDIHGTDSAKK